MTHATLEHIIDYLHGELEPAQDALVHQHLDSCAQCRAMHDEQARLSEALHVYAQASERDLPQGVVATIWDRVEREHARPSIFESLSALMRPAVALPIAAVLVAGVFFGSRFLQQPATANSIDVAYYLQDHAALTSTVPLHEGSVEPATLNSDVTATDQHWVATAGANIVTAFR